MGFLIYSDNQKQHLNLSHTAWNIIDNDIHTFLSGDDNPSLSKFLNIIIVNFLDGSNVNISEYLNLRTYYYKDIFKDMDVPLSSKDHSIFKLLLEDESNRITECNSYPKGIGKKFRLNNYVVSLLENDNNDSYFEGSIGKYLKSLFEEYARMPFHKRELIFYGEVYDIICSAIELKQEVKVTIPNGMSYYYQPITFTTDKINTFNYLVGFSYSDKATSDTKKISSLRLSNIVSARAYKSRSYFISKENQKDINNFLLNMDVQFVSSNTSLIELRLSNTGIKMYNNQIHLRPNYIKKDGNIYTFNCSQTQIYYYFFRYGHDVEILSPLSLRDRFRLLYEEAVVKYKNQNKS